MTEEETPSDGLYRFLDGLAASNGLPEVFYRKNASVFAPADPAQALFLLRSGRLKVVKTSTSRRDSVLRFVEAGDVFGEEGFPTGLHRGVGAKALEPSSSTAIPRHLFLDAAQAEPRAYLWLAERLSRRFHEVVTRIDLHSIRSARDRLILALADLAEHAAEAHRPDCTLRLRQNDLAGLIGANREITSLHLNILARQNLLSLGHGRLSITSVEDLRSAAQEVLAKLDRHPKRFRANVRTE